MCFPVKFARTIILKNISEHPIPTQMVFCKFYELFRNTYFLKDLRTAGSETPMRGSLFKGTLMQI